MPTRISVCPSWIVTKRIYFTNTKCIYARRQPWHVYKLLITRCVVNRTNDFRLTIRKHFWNIELSALLWIQIYQLIKKKVLEMWKR